MDTSALTSLTEDLVCPICLGEFENPRFLPCHHYYCAACINGACTRRTDDATWSIACPECRCVTLLKTRHAEVNLPPAFMVNRLKDKLQRTREQCSTANCSGHNCPLKYTCLDCNLPICPECVLTTHKNHSYGNSFECAPPPIPLKSSSVKTRARENPAPVVSVTQQPLSVPAAASNPPPLPPKALPSAPSLKPATSPSLTCGIEQPLSSRAESTNFPPLPPKKAHMVKETWYCSISRSEARSLLQGKIDGTFLCRPVSNSRAVCDDGEDSHVFTIDVMAASKIRHVKVLRINHKYTLHSVSCLNRVEFDSIVNLVLHYSKSAIKTSRTDAFLKYPVHDA